MQVKIHPSWKEKLAPEFEKPYFTELVDFVKDEYSKHQVYPPGPQIFRAFDETPFDEVKVVIIGQDPYHGPGQAHGLCFSVNEGVPVPPSLQNVYKEIHDDLGKPIPTNGDLSRWAKQGVLLLTATLTVRHKTPGSHQNKGWEQFTDAAIQALNSERENIVYMLWGSYAQKKAEMVDETENLILQTTHPSPFSAHRGFLGSKHFSKANAYLTKHGKEPIGW